VLNFLGCKFTGSSFDILAIFGDILCTDNCSALGNITLPITLITETCPSATVSISSSDSNFDSELTFYGTDSNFTESSSGLIYPGLDSPPIVLFYTYTITGPEGFKVTSYTLLNATLGGFNIMDPDFLTSPNGDFQTLPVGPSDLGFSIPGAKTLTLTVTVEIISEKRSMIFESKRMIQNPSSLTQGSVDTFIVVQSKSATTPTSTYLNHATSLHSLNMIIFVILLCFYSWKMV
jgi:hypothetical protein